MREKKHLTSQERTTLWLSRVIIWVFLIGMIFPLVWVLLSSFQQGNAFNSLNLIPSRFTTENYYNLFHDPTNPFGLWVINSMKVCFTVSVIQTFMAVLAAYAYSRLRFRGRKYGLMTLLILQMFPNFMAIAAVLTILIRLNLTDSLWGLILVLSGANAFNIWLLKGFIDGLPKELDEAVFVDGGNHWTVFTKIILPLARPMLVVIFLFTFIGVYSEFMLTSAAIHDPLKYTVPLGLRNFINNQFSTNWTEYSAAAVLASLPVMIVFMALQRYVESGLTRGAVK